mgnify:CR=1 FL=1
MLELFDLTLLAELPWAVYVQPHRDSERTYSRKLDGPKEGEELTQEVLAELIGQFAEKKLQHLELHWSQGDLVFRSAPTRVSGRPLPIWANTKSRFRRIEAGSWWTL